MKRLLKLSLALVAAGGTLAASAAGPATSAIATTSAEKASPPNAVSSPLVPDAIAPYCVNTYTNNVEPITLVQISDINNPSPAATGGTAHEDFTAIIGTLRPGATYAVTMKSNTDGAFLHGHALYVDWNQDTLLDGAGEGLFVGTITGSTGTDAASVSALVTVPAGATAGNTRLRAMTVYNATTLAGIPPCRTGAGYGQSEDYTVNIDPGAPMPPALPNLSKSFTPSNRDFSTPTTTLTLNLGQFNAGAASLNLTADLVDTLPAGMTVAATPNASTTCPSGVVTAAPGGATVTLGTGAQIPPAGCTVTADVQVAAVGIYANSIAAGALQTNAGAGPGASANFTATSATTATYSTGFEPPTFVVGNLGTQGGWGRSGGVAADTTISTAHPGADAQHLRLTWATAGTGTVAAISPTQGQGTTTYSIASGKLSIQPNATGTPFDFAPQDTGAGSVITRVRFNNDAAKSIQVLDPNGGGPGVVGYVNTGADWTALAGTTYFDLKVITKRADSTYRVCINGTSIFNGTGFAANLRNIAIIGTKGTGTNGNILDVDNVAIDNSNIGTCNGLPPSHTVTPSVGTPSGSISPNTPQTVIEGATTAFTLTANAGFHVDTVTGTCGGSLVGNTYTTNAVTADCTVVANFAADIVTHTVTPSVGTPSGSISPNTPQTVNDGATTAFTLAANAGFHVDTVTGTCGGNLAGNTYTTNAVTADCTVIANFAADGGGGTFPPDENFDEVTAPALPSGWVTSTTTGNDFTTVTTAADTAPNAAFATDLPAINDFTLDSPSFTPAGTTTLTFRHQFNLEDTYDGAVLEISINGGAFADIVTAGGSFGSGGYTDTISSGFSSPIAGRQAWSGSSGGFITTVVTLPAAATGQPTKLRFRTADDTSVAPSSGPGWWVDSIHLSFATLPSVAKAFAPSTVQINVDSTLTITLTNPTTTAATLTANLVDTLPAGVVATASSATTTCTGGAGASNTSGSVTLATGAVIPANGSCAVAVTVHSASPGSYVNTIPVGALQTTIGNNDTAANATLTTQSPPVAVITPSSLSLSVAAGGTGSTPLNIANTGGSTLTYATSEGTSAINAPNRMLQGNSYKTDSKAAQEMRAKYGAGSLSRNPKAGMPPAMHRPVTPLGALQISQMADNTPGDEGVSCGVSGTSTTANSWWRRFYFSEHPGVGASANVSSVTISSGSNGPSGVPVTINLYTIPHGTPTDTIPTASLTPIGTGTGTIDSGLVSVTIPVSGSVADTAGSDLVVEFHIEAVATGQFFPGANATTETHPTFLSAADCGVNEPTTASAIGFPNFHMTMVVGLGGTPPPTCANPTDIPWLSESPASGSVAAGANTDVSVAANAASLAEGTYTANVCVGTNDPVTPLVTVPVTLTVGPAPFVLCPNNAEEIFCDGFDPSGGQAGTYTDRTTFLTHVAAGYFENDFADAVPGPIPSMSYTNGGWAYTITASSDTLYNDTGLISTNLAADSIVVTFTGDPVSAVGGNFWSTDINVQPTGTDTVITLSDGTTETFTSTGPTDFRGFTTAAPITTLNVDAPDSGGNFWPTMDNLIVGTGQ